MASIQHALRRIKDDLPRFLSKSVIEGICTESGHLWRDRMLSPLVFIHAFILQILQGNASCAHVPRILGREFSASAYCQARKRLPLQVIKALATRISVALQESAGTAGLWHGHRVVLIDGSSFSMPDTRALQEHFGQSGAQKKGCGFPTAHLLAAFDIHSGLILDMIASPLRTHDMADVHKIHDALKSGDVLVGDRGFCSFAHLALAGQRGMQACFRMHQIQIVDFRVHRRHATSPKNSKGLPRSRWLRRLGFHDQVVEWIKPSSKPCWMTEVQFAVLPETITVRELRYRVISRAHRTREITWVTTLLDAQEYPAEELADLYLRRWQVETNIRHLKTTMKMDILHCQTLDGVLKEMWLFVLVYNLVRRIMLEAAKRQEVKPDRISFADALHWLMHAPPGQPLPALVVNPHRPFRLEPRAIKRRRKEYDRVNRPRSEMRKSVRKYEKAA